MNRTPKFINRWKPFWEQAFKALEFNGITGDYVEFGSNSGKTFRSAYDVLCNHKSIPRHMWSFDSFQGLPEITAAEDQGHPIYQKGNMSMDGVENFRRILTKHGIPRNQYTTVEGYYEDTLPKLSPSDSPTDIALAYIDCDLYSSTQTVLTFLEPRLKNGMIIGFDDYFLWTPNNASGERIAMKEFLERNPKWNFVPYRDIHWAGASFMVEHR